MGHTKLELDVYSCAVCGWIGIHPRVVKVKELASDEMGQVHNGSRGGQMRQRFECPNCRTPIKPSSPVDLIEVATIEARKKKENLSSTVALTNSDGEKDDLVDPGAQANLQDQENVHDADLQNADPQG